MRVGSVVASLLVALASSAAAEPMVSYQGLVTDALGAPIDGSVDLVFTLYDDEAAGNAVWSESHPEQPVVDGEFNVLLGSVTPLDPSSFDNPYLWLEFEIDGETLAPRQRVTSVPFALRAGCNPGDRLGCYSGEESTVGIGQCREGARRCDTNGRWGACAGEILPAAEVCGNGLDENCDATADEGCGAPDGSACAIGSECQSLHCQNGYCCASGDCCASAGDCAGYGEVPVCASPANCQGTRRDGVCSAASQCATGVQIDDDSGCSGELVNTCGAYPSVFCSNAPSQAPPACATSCVNDAGCDPVAHCSMNVCVPD